MFARRWNPSELLPHGTRFRFVTTVEKCEDGVIAASWTVTGEEWFCSDHFPENPIVPGVLIGEALAQAAGIALRTAPEVTLAELPEGRLAQIDLKFRATARPPLSIELSARHAGTLGALHRFDVTARSGKVILASGHLVLSVQTTENVTTTQA